MDKVNIFIIFQQYLDVLKQNNKHLNKADIVIQFIVPLLFGLLYYFVPSISECIQRDILSNAIMAISIVASLLYALSIMLFQLRLSITVKNNNPSLIIQKESIRNNIVVESQEAKFIDELFCVTLWSVVIGFISVLLLVVCQLDFPSECINRIFPSLAISCICNFIFSTCICLKRLSITYLIASKSWNRQH